MRKAEAPGGEDQPMKIIAAETILLTIPYRTSGGLQAIAGRPSAGLNMLLVRLETDGGVIGWGEAFGHGVCPASKTAFDTLVAPMLIGRDPSGIDVLMDDLSRTLHLFGRSGAVMYALSGVDIALWDIAGKVAGKPLYEMFGGDARPREAYASLLRCSGPDAVAKSCERALEQGYRHIKLHEITVPAVKAARDATGPDVPLMVDTNCPWSVDEAIAMAQALRPFDMLLAGGAGLAARGSRGTCEGSRCGRRDCGGRERGGADRISPRIRAWRARCRAAERDQDRRHFGDAPHHRARQGVRCARRAALPVFRPRLHREPASDRGIAGGRDGRAARGRSGSKPVRRFRRSSQRTARCACRKGRASASIPIRR